MTLTLYLEEEI